MDSFSYFLLDRLLTTHDKLFISNFFIEFIPNFLRYILRGILASWCNLATIIMTEDSDAPFITKQNYVFKTIDDNQMQTILDEKDKNHSKSHSKCCITVRSVFKTEKFTEHHGHRSRTFGQHIEELLRWTTPTKGWKLCSTES